ncbi:Piezo non-specific cation channel, R-Ras-binding domain, partial [Dillenia turbinata]
MGSFLAGFFLPLLLLAGHRFQRRGILLWPIAIFSLFVILLQLTFLILWAIEGDEWSIKDAWWAKLIGCIINKSGRYTLMIYFLVIQVLLVFVAFIEIYRNRFFWVPWRHSCWERFSSASEHLGSHLRVASCLLLPAIQLVVGISHPSWVSIPYFICSCVGLVDWSLTSNFLGLFRWWRPLQLYSGFNIILLYVYQLPIALPKGTEKVAGIIGLYKISAKSQWPEIISLLSYVKCDLMEMDFIMSSEESSLNEQLLPSKHSFFIRQSRSGARHTNILLRGAVSLFALSFWSFNFASLCAFALLAYVGYIVYAFPSLFRLHRLNGPLLVFILLWAASTYIFNVAFTLVNWKLGEDMKIWEMIGLWHYPIPGLFLLAQFCLGILVAAGNLVNNSVFLYVSDEEVGSLHDSRPLEAKDDTKVLIVATIAWGLRKISRAIMLVLIFFIATKPGFFHAIYMVFFLMYLLSHNISRKARQILILLCECHFALLYILQLNLVYETLLKTGPLTVEILSQSGLLKQDSSWDFLEIALLACVCAIHNHGFEVLFSFSAIVQRAPCHPVGFSILKAGLNKSVLLSIYSSPTSRAGHDNLIHERRIASYLGAIGQECLSIYRSCGTYVAFLTILVTVYLVTPNYVSFGYLFLLLLWISGRQLVEKTKKRLWFPLKAYAVLVFVFIYSLSICPTFQMWLSDMIDLHRYLGFESEASLFKNVWISLAVLIVMQLYSYERRESRLNRLEDSGVPGFFRRFLIWHSQKILLVMIFYASLSPVCASGLVYLLGLVICSTLPKASRIPSKCFLVYTGLMVLTEYLFQMFGELAEMFPGQKNSDLSLFLGFEVFQPGFWGLESGLRGKILVIAACTLQYNVFRWLEKMPRTILNSKKWEEPCPLFLSAEDAWSVVSVSNGETKLDLDSITESEKQNGLTCNIWPYLSHPITSEAEASQNGHTGKDSFAYIWGSSEGTHKWNKRHIITLKKERFEAQKTALKVYLMFWIENMFNLFGLEINMIALLLASFALLNVVSLLYIALLAACILLDRRTLRKLWPMFVFLFASILILEYFALWRNTVLLNQDQPSETAVHCHECWRSSNLYLNFCKNCWLGLVIDDPRMLVSYYLIFMLACFKLRADNVSGMLGSSTFRQMINQRKNAFVWRDLSIETKSLWTFLDYLRLYCFCHLLDLVLALILITGTLEYDILHLGYLAFALVFFRMRLEILKKKNKIFKFLRIYNFVLIVLSLSFQSPFIGELNEGKCETIDYIYEVIGLYKYDYGFKITSRSALVEIIIFILVALQSYMFSSQEFDYISRYLEAEQIGAIVREQEKKATWKTAQLQHIRDSEEKKRQRNLQVEKMKSEMLNLQSQLHGTNSFVNLDNTSLANEGLRRRRKRSSRSLNPYREDWDPDKEEALEQEENNKIDSLFSSEPHDSLSEVKTRFPSAENSTRHFLQTPLCEISEIEEDAVSSSTFDSGKGEKVEGQAQENAFTSAVQLIGDGVSQVQIIGNQAVNNLVSFLNIENDDSTSESNENSASKDTLCDEAESKHMRYGTFDRVSSVQSDKNKTTSDSVTLQIGRIICHFWSKMRSNNDIVCYCCFVLVFLWNFSLLSMVYLAALFLYALCVNTGPSYIFWVIVLIYTEVYILLQYLYQIVIQHCGLSFHSDLLDELGLPAHKIKSSFVISSLPLFLVYLFTLLQSSISATDGKWMYLAEFNIFNKRALYRKDTSLNSSWTRSLRRTLQLVAGMVKMIIRSFSRFWKSLTRGAESPPYFVQLSMDVQVWPEDGIQPDKIESGINQLLKIVHDEICREKSPNLCPSASRVQVQSIERSDQNSNVALAVLEVVYASPLTECAEVEWYRSLTPAADVAKEILKAQQAGIANQIGFPYQIISVIGGGKREIDLYAYIFGADLAVFFLVAIFYQYVIRNRSQILDVYQLEDQFPKEFVFILMVLFFLIVLDRIIYLCSFATGKVIFYLFNLVLFTYSVTEYARTMPPTQQAGVLVLRAIFLTKAISLALQAVQIRYGVPHKSTLYRQFLTSNVSRVNYLGYRLYRALPFLYELRCVLDWSCTTTSLTMYDWLKLEDIHASLYLVKCDAVLNRAHHKQGEKQSVWTKFCSGICLFFILLCVIWAPMLIYSSGNPTNIANPIKDASFKIDLQTLDGRLALYQTTLCKRIPLDDLDENVNIVPDDYLSLYSRSDIQLICCQPDANTLWLVPDIVLRRFIQSLNWDMDVSFSWILTRDRPKGKEVVKYGRDVDPLYLPKPADVQNVLNGTNNSFRVNNIYPRHFRVTGSEGIIGETLSKFSIWGLYITFVLAVGRFIRLQCSDLRMRIPYENLPSCDRLIALCEDIYAARAEGELGVEEITSHAIGIHKARLDSQSGSSHQQHNSLTANIRF